MTSLYELSNDFKEAAVALAEVDDPRAIADTLEGLKIPVEQKALQVARYIGNLDSEAKAIKEAEARMKARRDALNAKAARIKAYLKDNMEKCGIDRLSCEYFALSIKKNPPALVIDNEAAIPGEFVEEVVVKKIDKASLKKYLKNNDEEYAHITHGTRLEIK